MAFFEKDYAWVIDRDLCVSSEEESYAGFCGPKNPNMQLVDELNANIFAGKRFRIRYSESPIEEILVAFKGRFISQSDESFFENFDEPLEFLSTVTRCDIIEYRIDGKWEEIL